MTKNKNTLSKVFSTGILLSGFVLSQFFLSSLSTQAQTEVDLDFELLASKDIAVYPCESDESISQTKSWIIEKVEPGTTIDACMVVANPTEEIKNIQVGAQDAVPTADGAISMSSEVAELTGVGSWMDLGDFPEIVEVNPEKGEKLEFKINVPADASAGEYAGAISVLEVDNEEKSGNFKILRRYGARIYITVTPEEDLNLKTEFNRFEFITPSSDLWEKYAKSAKGFNWDDIVMTWAVENQGNIFVKNKGTLTITDPNGQTFTREFSSDNFPNNEALKTYQETGDAKWVQPGTYKARYEFTNEASVPWNKPNNITDESSANFVETEITITQADLDQMKAEKQTLDSVLAQDDTPREPVESGSIDALDVPEEEKEEEEEKGEEGDNTLLIAIGAGAGVIVLLLVVVIIVLLKKNGDKKNDDNQSGQNNGGNEQNTQVNSTVTQAQPYVEPERQEAQTENTDNPVQ